MPWRNSASLTWLSIIEKGQDALHPVGFPVKTERNSWLHLRKGETEQFSGLFVNVTDAVTITYLPGTPLRINPQPKRDVVLKMWSGEGIRLGSFDLNAVIRKPYKTMELISSDSKYQTTITVRAVPSWIIDPKTLSKDFTTERIEIQGLLSEAEGFLLLAKGDIPPHTGVEELGGLSISAQHRLIGEGVEFIRSPNMGGVLSDPQYLVFHFSAVPNADSFIKVVTNPTAKGSPHLLIAKNGNITQFVPFNRMAWHAGQSRWKDLVGLNRYSIGVSLDNPGKLSGHGGSWTTWYGSTIPDDQVLVAKHKHEDREAGWAKYTNLQIARAVQVAQLLVSTYGIKDVLGNDDIAPGRKVGPGPAFPLSRVRSKIYDLDLLAESYRRFEAVLKMEPRNFVAQDGIDRVGQAYVFLIKEAIDKQQFEKAVLYLERAQGFFPHDARLEGLRQNLQNR
jgi:N-acetyl-anhydromuramyl-L-alanine amidase AmpD